MDRSILHLFSKMADDQKWFESVSSARQMEIKIKVFQRVHAWDLDFKKSGSHKKLFEFVKAVAEKKAAVQDTCLCKLSFPQRQPLYWIYWVGSHRGVHPATDVSDIRGVGWAHRWTPENVGMAKLLSVVTVTEPRRQLKLILTDTLKKTCFAVCFSGQIF